VSDKKKNSATKNVLRLPATSPPRYSAAPRRHQMAPPFGLVTKIKIYARHKINLFQTAILRQTSAGSLYRVF